MLVIIFKVTYCAPKSFLKINIKINHTSNFKSLWNKIVLKNQLVGMHFYVII